MSPNSNAVAGIPIYSGFFARFVVLAPSVLTLSLMCGKCKRGLFRCLDLLRVLRNSINYSWCGYLLIGAPCAMAAPPNHGGQSGYINMPRAVVESGGTFSLGYMFRFV